MLSRKIVALTKSERSESLRPQSGEKFGERLGIWNRASVCCWDSCKHSRVLLKSHRVLDHSDSRCSTIRMQNSLTWPGASDLLYIKCANGKFIMHIRLACMCNVKDETLVRFSQPTPASPFIRYNKRMELNCD